MNGAGAGFVTKIPHLVHLRGHALQQCSMAVFNPQFQRTRYQGRHGSNTRAWSMDIQDALDLHLKEEAFRIIGKIVECHGRSTLNLRQCGTDDGVVRNHEEHQHEGGQYRGGEQLNIVF